MMKRKITPKLILIGCLCFSLGMFSQNPSTVRLVNAGKMKIAPNVGQGQVTMYIPDGVRMSGNDVSVVQDGITAIGGDFINNITGGNIFDPGSLGAIRFQGSNLQSIQGNANRSLNYIAFPDVEVINPSSVQLASTMGMDVKHLILTKGKIVLKSTAKDDASSNLAHMRVRGDVTYNHTAPSVNDRGVVEIELDLQRSGGRSQRFFGFTPPYKKMYADYFFYNYMTVPDANGLFGQTGQTQTDPFYVMSGGKGYLIGQEVFGQGNEPAYPVLPGYEGVKFEDRMQNMLRLNRNALTSTINVAGGKPDAYNEEIQTGDVTVNLQAGINYLGNPFTSPLDMTSFLNATTSTDATNNPWQVTRGTTTGSSLRNTFWVLSQGNVTSSNLATKTFGITATWLVAQAVGSLYNIDNAEIQIEPMQMFRVQASKATTMVIPASQQTHGNTSFLRSAPANPIVDELLIQVTDDNTKGFDRMCVVFRNNASMNAVDPYDTEKLFNYTGGVSQLYTPSGEGKNMAVNVIPSDTKSLALNLKACSEPKDIELQAYRLESLQSPQGVWLEDRLTHQTIDLMQTPSYHFQTSPKDTDDRFILHFQRNNTPTGIEDINSSSIYAYYRDGMLTLTGLNAQDAGSRLMIVDIRGVIMQSSTIDKNASSGSYQVNFQAPTGVYIVKLSGIRPFTSKLIVK